MTSNDEALMAGAALGGYRFIDLHMEDGARLDLALAAGAVEAEGWDTGAQRRIRLDAGGRSVGGPCPLDAGGPWQVACSVTGFAHQRPRMPELLERVEEAFVGRTPLRRADDLSILLGRFAPRAPHWLVHGLDRAGDEIRADFMLSRAAHFHQAAPDERSRRTPPDAAREIDVEASGRAGALWSSAGAGLPAILRLREEIADLGTQSRYALLGPLRTAAAALMALPPGAGHFGSARYWAMLLRGLVALLETQEVDAENPFIGFLRRGVARGEYDPLMSGSLATDAAAVARLGPRLERFLDILATRRLDHPVVVFNATPGAGSSDMDCLALADGTRCSATLMDGNHRLAALWLAGAKRCPALFVWSGHAEDAEGNARKAEAMLRLG